MSDDTMTPSQRIIADAAELKELTTAAGRKLTVKRLTTLEHVRLLRAIGAEQSNNQPYRQMVELAAQVVKIDGRPVPFPKNERQIDNILEKLDDDGMNTVMVHFLATIKQAQADAEEALANADDEDEGQPVVQSPLDTSSAA